MNPYVWRLVAVALALAAVLAGPAPALAQPTPQRIGLPPEEADYPIPNGQFFTQAAPGQRGAGYRVANEAGIPFFDAFKAEGGVGALGYPLTRRFISRGAVVQLFQNGALRWNAEEAKAEVKPVREVGDPPTEAKRAEPPLSFSGEAERQPWSGWWWPANDVVGGPRLIDANGPLARYDRYTESIHKGTASTLEWERAELRFSSVSWAGHCNGWAAAALLEPEPTRERVLNGVTFTVADQKGLLSSYHFADAAEWGAGSFDEDLTPAEFHKWVTTWIGGERKGAIFTFRPAGEEVWSYPAFKFETHMGPDPVEPDTWHVETVVWLVDNDVPASFQGARLWPGPDGKTFRYTLRGNDPYAARGGEWAVSTNQRFGRPFMVWYPDPTRRNVDRQLASPDLDYRLLLDITRGAERRPLFVPRADPT